MTPSVWRPGVAASAAAISELEHSYPGLPTAYLTQLRDDGAAEGDLSVDPGWIAFWPAAEVASRNANYKVSDNLPGFIGFGSNGGGELLAFDVRTNPWRVCMIPFIPMHEVEAVEIASDFETFSLHFGRNASIR